MKSAPAGADLREATFKLQVACIFIQEFAATRSLVLWTRACKERHLRVRDLEGIHYDDIAMSFAKHIRYGNGKESMLHAAIFEGGLTVERRREDSLIEGLPQLKMQRESLREKLEPHIGKPENKQLAM